MFSQLQQLFQTALTPNGDGNNDFFEIFGYKEAWKTIWSRGIRSLGRKVYQSNDMNFKWMGLSGEKWWTKPFGLLVKLVYLDNYTKTAYRDGYFDTLESLAF